MAINVIQVVNVQPHNNIGGFLLVFLSILKKNQNAPRRSEHPPVRDILLTYYSILAINRVAKKMGTYFEMGTDGHRCVCFQIGIS